MVFICIFHDDIKIIIAKEITLQISSVFDVFDTKERVKVYPSHHNAIIKEPLDKSKFHIQRSRCQFLLATFNNIGIGMSSIDFIKRCNTHRKTKALKVIQLGLNITNLFNFHASSFYLFQERKNSFFIARNLMFSINILNIK